MITKTIIFDKENNFTLISVEIKLKINKFDIENLIY